MKTVRILAADLAFAAFNLATAYAFAVSWEQAMNVSLFFMILRIGANLLVLVGLVCLAAEPPKGDKPFDELGKTLKILKKYRWWFGLTWLTNVAAIVICAAQSAFFLAGLFIFNMVVNSLAESVGKNMMAKHDDAPA